MTARLLLAASALTALLAPAAAHAAWTPVTTPGASNTDEVGLLRTPDENLHVVWRRQPDATSYELDHTVIAAGGSVGAAQPIASGWAGIGSPALVRTAAGELRLFAAAQRSIDAGDPIQNVAQWTSGDGGASWSLTPADVATGAGFADPMGAAMGADGATPFFGWGTSAGLFVHRGADAATPSSDLQAANGQGCCGYEPSLALGGGELDAAWYSNASGHAGVWAQALDQATGAPVGQAARMPATAGSVAPDQRVGLTGRTAGGVFAAYSGGGVAATKVLVWRVGAPGSVAVASGHGTLRVPAISATPEGRLWVAWAGGGRIYARRSNRAATAWGATTSIPVRHGTGVVYKLAAAAQSQVLDVLAGFEPAGGTGVQTWHSRLRPGLTLSLSRRSAHAVKLRVTDAGEPVAGARVTLAGRRATTGASGAVTLPRRAASASASKSGYVGATLRVR